MIWFCNVITTDLCEKSNPKKSSNNKQSFINGVNKPFMGLFLCRDTYMIPVLIVPQILMSTKQKLSMQQQSFSLQIICWEHVEIALFNTLA